LNKSKIIKIRNILFVITAVLLLYYLPKTIYNRHFNPQRLPVTETALETSKTIDLPDGSRINLEAKSTFVYTKEFPEHQRKTELKGGAFVDIKDDSRPFVMKLKRCLLITNQGKILVKEWKGMSYEVFVKAGDLKIEEYNKSGDLENVYKIKSGKRVIIGEYVQLN